MSTLRLPVLATLCASVLVGMAAHGVTIAHAGGPVPSAVARPATAVAARSAVLQGTVNPNDEPTDYWFVFGPASAPSATVTSSMHLNKGKSDVAVSAGVTGLVPATTYHMRVVAKNKNGTTFSADVTFTTASESTGGGTTPPPPGTPTAPATPGSTAPLAPAAVPELGHSVNVTETAGTVLVRVPGATSAVPLAGTASVPVGAILDTRKGTVELKTAMPAGHTQTGTFHGGVFAVRQSVTGGGMTELVLRGPRPTCRAAAARTAATSARRPPRTLWGSDHGGRFRTRGSNAVATVRGTSWVMADRCDGTYTRVKTGSVRVRELRSGRTIVLRAGQSHLARTAH
jgi:hypothetical protein